MENEVNTQRVLFSTNLKRILNIEILVTDDCLCMILLLLSTTFRMNAPVYKSQALPPIESLVCNPFQNMCTDMCTFRAVINSVNS